jgi:predicted lipoprotein with Yx(FWY)xxD motif
MRRFRVLPLVAALGAALALTACGGDDGGDYSDSPVPVQAPVPLPGETALPPLTTSAPVVASSAASAAPLAGGVASGVELAVREAPGLGTVVADGQGYTLYRFDQDTPRPPAASCVAECARTWPPVVADPEGALELEGVDQSAIGFVQRPDGDSQVTIAGWPVYRYSGDTVPGATTGQGVDDTWFAITPEGEKVPG